MNHTEDCTGDTCSPLEGSWDQPDAQHVRLAEADGLPWCVTRERAFELVLGVIR